MGFCGTRTPASEMHPSMYGHRERSIIVVVHVGDFLRVVSTHGGLWLFEELRDTYDLKKRVLELDS